MHVEPDCKASTSALSSCGKGACCEELKIAYLQDYEGALAFTINMWTSPNHCSFIALCMHFEHNDEPLSMVLDVIELTKSHTGTHLAQAFTEVLDDFGISTKVRTWIRTPCTLRKLMQGIFRRCV